MELLTQLNRAMSYIEEHIRNDLLLSGVSSVTTYSQYHFGRLFYYIADMPLSEYIRRRKLSLAAMELQGGKVQTPVKIIDLAVKYGYDSADSFTRAFTKQHGCSPSAARKLATPLKIYSPLTFQIKIKGVEGMNWRIEQREAFEAFGIERMFGNEETDKISGFWTELLQNGQHGKLVADAGGGEPIVEGACAVNALCGHIDEKNSDSFFYMLFAFKNAGSKTGGYKTVTVPKATWAVFRAEKDVSGVCKIPDLFRQAYSEWLPSSGYDKDFGDNVPADMEVYGEKFDEVWIPVIKK